MTDEKNDDESGAFYAFIFALVFLILCMVVLFSGDNSSGFGPLVFYPNCNATSITGCIGVI